MGFRRLVIQNVTLRFARLRLPFPDPASADGLALLLARRMARLPKVRLATRGSLRMTRKNNTPQKQNGRAFFTNGTDWELGPNRGRSRDIEKGAYDIVRPNFYF